MCEQVPMNEYVRACRHGRARVRTRVISVFVVCVLMCACVSLNVQVCMHG